MRLCGGCQSKIADNVRFCAGCAAERNKPAVDDGIKSHTAGDRDRYAFLYTGERWKRGVQPKAKKKYPICARCPAATDHIDHIVPAGEAIRQVQESGRYPFSKYEGFYLMSNLQGLCHSCHVVKTLEDKGHCGEWPSVLAKHDAQPKKIWSF